MKNLVKFLSAGVLAATSLVSCSQKDINTNVTPKNGADSVSYAIGYMEGINFREQLKELNMDNFLAGLQLALNNDTAKTIFKSPQEAQMFVRTYMIAKQQRIAQENLEKGQKFLTDSVAKIAGIQKTESGIYYKVIKAGEGEHATEDDEVEVDYVGKLIDGTEFDSSIKRGQAAKFPVKGVIKGWQEIIPMMPLGSEWEVYIPSELAYGPQGNPVIPGNSVLIFNITLHQIFKADAKEEAKE
jgi:FKBP-type peptidyl-prolyl cis-trans isomerase